MNCKKIIALLVAAVSLFTAVPTIAVGANDVESYVDDKVYCNVVGHLHVEAVSPDCVQPVPDQWLDAASEMTPKDEQFMLDRLTKLIAARESIDSLMVLPVEEIDRYATGDMCWCGGYRMETTFQSVENRPCPSHGGSCIDYFALYEFYYCWCTGYCGDTYYSPKFFVMYNHF